MDEGMHRILVRVRPDHVVEHPDAFEDLKLMALSDLHELANRIQLGCLSDDQDVRMRARLMVYEMTVELDDRFRQLDGELPIPLRDD